MRTIAVTAFLAALLCSAPAIGAGPYTDAVEKHQQCAREGRMGAEAFSKDTIFGKTLKEHSAANERGDLPKEAMMGILMIFIAVDREKIASEQDAYMKVWAECMDRKR